MAGSVSRKVVGHLRTLYPHLDGDALDTLAQTLLATMGTPFAQSPLASGPAQGEPAQDGPTQGETLWTERDVMLIVYGDSVTTAGERPLVTLRRTLTERFADVISTVHVLPFFPFTSDDGFAVTDHCEVAAHLGTANDVAALANDFKLMADLIVNHVSFEHRWVRQFLADCEPGRRLLRTIDETEDLSLVARPRTSPLGRTVETAAGVRELWCTFSHDQVDLDYREPDTLIELVKVVRWLLDLGTSWLRLDAVAYVWDESGTSCVHLPQTHEVVKLLRTLTASQRDDEHDDRHGNGHADGGTVIVTETNVPHEDNVSYFGDGDEAHVVYNFTLAPMLTHALLCGSSAAVQRWLGNLDQPPAGCTVLNFLASHDGIGLRPAEGLLDDEQIAALVAASHAAGGSHSQYSSEAGTRPYEINVSLFDLLAPRDDPHGIDRYVAAHAVMLALAGVPAFYLHGILGTPNHRPGVQPDGASDHEAGDGHRPMATTDARQINRRKLTADELGELAESPCAVLGELKRLTKLRRAQPAFHPESSQRAAPISGDVLSFVRGERNGPSVAAIWCLTNVTARRVTVSAARKALTADLGDLLSDARFAASEPIDLAPYGSLWLTPTNK